MTKDAVDKFSDQLVKDAAKANRYLTCLNNLRNHDDLKGLFKYNLMKECPEYAYSPPWDETIQKDQEVRDIDLISLKTYFSEKKQINLSKDHVLEVILTASRDYRYHAIKDYLNALKWDNTKRLDTWLIDNIGAEDNVYVRAISQKILIASVARIFEPGIKFDQLVVLEGGQGIGKSMLIKYLAGEKFYSNISFHYKDQQIIECMRGKWFLEFDEMVDIGKQDIERVKSLLSRGTDRIRMAYGRLAEDYPRSCVMIGTLNPKGNNTYLQDETGNRRFWPVTCSGRLNIDNFLNVRDQLFAEAVKLYKDGEALWFDETKSEHADILGIAKQLQEDRVEVDPWVKPIEKYLLDTTENRIVPYNILKTCLNLGDEKITKFNAGRVGGILRKLGYKPTRSLKEGRYFTKEEVDTIDFSE